MSIEQPVALGVPLTGVQLIEASFEARLGALRQVLLEEAHAALKERLREGRLQTYDALLENIYDALAGPRGETLAALLRQRYPAALIDEFQDTDPLQYAIFRRIYGAGGNALVLVGDPKQAIYSFRGADLHTYLKARERCRRVHTLHQNQRSVAGLVTGLNTLFGTHAHPFRLPRVAFTPVRAPGSATRRPRGAGPERPRPAAGVPVRWLPANGEATSNRSAVLTSANEQARTRALRSLHRKSDRYRAAVRRKLAAYHRHIQVGLISQGILEYLAVKHPRRVWASFGFVVAHRRPGIPPSELVTAAAMRNALPEFLADPDSCPIFKKFLRDRLDPTRYEPLRLAG